MSVERQLRQIIQVVTVDERAEARTPLLQLNLQKASIATFNTTNEHIKNKYFSVQKEFLENKKNNGVCTYRISAACCILLMAHKIAKWLVILEHHMLCNAVENCCDN